MPRKKGPEMVQVGFRLPKDLVKRLDLYVEELQKTRGTASRSDAIRELLIEKLDEKERGSK